MTPEAPKRSLDAPSEAAHREPDPIRGYSSDFDPTTEGTRLIGEFVFHDGHWWYAGRREAAHPSGAGSGRTCQRCGKDASDRHFGLCCDCSEHVADEVVAGLRVAPSAPGDSLDVETLARALHEVYCHLNRPMHSHATHSADAIAAEYARLRSTPAPRPTGATPESEG